MQGTKVFLRRDVADYAEAFAFDAGTDEYLDVCRTNVFRSAFFAESPVQVEQFRHAIAAKRRHEKISRAYAKQVMAGGEETIADLAAAFAPAPEAAPRVHEIPNTAMDKVVRQIERQAKEGTEDLSYLVPEERPETGALFTSEVDRDRLKTGT